VNEFVSGPVGVRQEGDVTIVPVLEEVLVVEKRLMLREEIRVTRRRETKRHVEHVALRTEEARVLRADGDADGDGGSDGEAKPAG
jgi:stress response protein YsnF